MAKITHNSKKNYINKNISGPLFTLKIYVLQKQNIRVKSVWFNGVIAALSHPRLLIKGEKITQIFFWVMELSDSMEENPGRTYQLKDLLSKIKG